jgi:predicted DNA-binding transcriptional regulator YafY
MPLTVRGCSGRSARYAQLNEKQGEVELGQRTSTETLVGLLCAFWRKKTWSQADLAREVGVNPRAVRRCLDELTTSGWPLERDEDHPHVYWSLPKDWLPVGVLLTPQATADLVKSLVHVPAGPGRTRLLEAVSSHAPAPLLEVLNRAIPPRASEAENHLLPKLLDGLAQQSPVRLKYWTASRGALGTRTVSVQRVLVGPPTRFLAWCHMSQSLRWFRLDNASTIEADPSATFHSVDEGELDVVVQESVEGFHGQERLRVVFRVRDPEARWVAHNLPDGLSYTPVPDGILVDAETRGLLPIARFLVGLGGAAYCETPELAALVRKLATGALRGLSQE